MIMRNASTLSTPKHNHVAMMMKEYIMQSCNVRVTTSISVA
jgi:hypothetical protein